MLYEVITEEEADRGEELAAEQGQVIAEQQVDVGVLERDIGASILLDRRLQLALQEDQVLVLVVEDRVEVDHAETARVVRAIGVADRAVAPQVHERIAAQHLTVLAITLDLLDLVLYLLHFLLRCGLLLDLLDFLLRRRLLALLQD